MKIMFNLQNQRSRDQLARLVVQAKTQVIELNLNPKENPTDVKKRAILKETNEKTHTYCIINV